MSLLNLPVELVRDIADKIHPSSIVEFARTCRAAHACSENSLKLHRERQRTLRAQHDRHPMNIVNLIRTLKQSPELAWYVRVLEFYGTRETFQDWTTYYDYKRARNEPRVDLTDQGPEIFEDLGLEDEIHQLFSRAPCVERDYGLFEPYKTGDDRPLKTILIGLCPELEKVSWVAHALSDNADQPFGLLCELVSAYEDRESFDWPASLVNLRSISIGTCIEHVHPHDNLHPNTREFCELLLLPNLKSLRINVGGFGDQDLDFLNEVVPEHSSSVEELTLYCCNFDTEIVIAVLERLRCLRSYIDLQSTGDQHELLSRIQPWFGDTLETLVLNPSSSNYRGLYKDVTILSGFRNLQTFNLELLELQAKSDDEADPSAELPAVESSAGSGKDDFAWIDLDGVLPPLAETIKVMYSRPYGGPGFSAQRVQSSLEQLDLFVRKRGRNNDGGCLETVEIAFGATDMGDKDLVEKMLKERRDVWSNAGVELVTNRNRIQDYEQEILETAPDIPDFTTDDEEDSD